MATVSVAEAKARLSEILSKVKDGEDIIITRRGEPVARIASLKKPLKSLSSLKGFRDKIPPSASSSAKLVRQMRDGGY